MLSEFLSFISLQIMNRTVEKELFFCSFTYVSYYENYFWYMRNINIK